MIRYSRLDDATRAAIVNKYVGVMQLGATTVTHAAAIVANDVLPWKGRKCKIDKVSGLHERGRCAKCEHDTDAYSVALAVIVHSGAAEVKPLQSEKGYARRPPRCKQCRHRHHKDDSCIYHESDAAAYNCGCYE